MKYCFLLLLTICLITEVLAREEIHIVQAVSSDQRNLILPKGTREGVIKGQEVVLANGNVNLVCRAIEVTHNYSLWEPIERNVNIPFKKNDIIDFIPHAYGSVIVNTDNLELPEIYKEEVNHFRQSNSWSLFYNYAFGLYQTSSDVSTSNNSKRSGSQFAGEYHYRFSPEFELSAGARYDVEVYRLDAGNVDVETKRTMLTGSITYHLISWTKSKKQNWYATLTGGIGKSTTAVDESTSSGRAYIIPELRIGFLLPFTSTKAFQFEASVENISSTEKFSDGISQNNTIINSKVSVGLRF